MRHLLSVCFNHKVSDCFWKHWHNTVNISLFCQSKWNDHVKLCTSRSGSRSRPLVGLFSIVAVSPVRRFVIADGEWRKGLQDSELKQIFESLDEYLQRDANLPSANASFIDMRFTLLSLSSFTTHERQRFIVTFDFHLNVRFWRRP